jgi:hyaluronan synthase
MSLPVYYYVLGTPLGILGLVRWGCWLVRRIPAVLYKPIAGGHRATMTVVVPVYQEDPAVFAAAIESWLANDVQDVVLVIDSSDRPCLEVAARYPVRVLVSDVPGKRDALRRGWNAARTELVALVDSDTVWAPDVAREVCQPFADPRIGGVGTRQSVYGSGGFLARITDMFLDHRYYDENASQSLLGRAVSCLSGRTAVYRRALLLEIEHDFMHETFWGVPCLSGDDKRLTTLILERGHLTYMQRTAEVWSTFPSDWRTFVKQRLRWARNTWRSDLRALSRRWVWRRPFLAYTMVDKAVSGFTLLLGPAFLTYSLLVHNWIFCAVLVGWWQISRSAKLLPHLRQRPSSFLFILPYVVVSWVMALIKLYALLTLRKQRWGTRQVAVRDGEVVRTGDPVATPATPHPMPAPVPVPVPVPATSMPARRPAAPPIPAQPIPAQRHDQRFGVETEAGHPLSHRNGDHEPAGWDRVPPQRAHPPVNSAPPPRRDQPAPHRDQPAPGGHRPRPVRIAPDTSAPTPVGWFDSAPAAAVPEAVPAGRAAHRSEGPA